MVRWKLISWLNLKVNQTEYQVFDVLMDYGNPLHLDMVDRYLQRIRDKTIPDEDPPSLECFIPMSRRYRSATIVWWIICLLHKRNVYFNWKTQQYRLRKWRAVACTNNATQMTVGFGATWCMPSTKTLVPSLQKYIKRNCTNGDLRHLGFMDYLSNLSKSP